MALRSRLARWAPFLLTGLGYLYASAPDFGITVLQSRWGFLGLVLLWITSHHVTQLVTGSEIAAYRSAFRSVGDIISVLSADVDETGAPRLVQAPAEAIDALLRRAREIAVTALRPHADCTITAHLLVPEWGEKRGRSVIVGLRASRHDDFRPDRSHEVISLDSPGAGRAFSTGEPSAVPDTERVASARIQGRPYKSVAAFPVIIGARGRGGRVRAVVTLDATSAYVFTEKSIARLASFINPVAQLIGLALVTREQRERP